MTDFRALCGELLEELLARPLIIDLDLIDRARAALDAAPDSPAVPVGEKPVAWLWEYVGSDPYPGKGTLVGRSLHEMDPDFPPYPDQWRPLKPIYGPRPAAAQWGGG